MGLSPVLAKQYSCQALDALECQTRLPHVEYPSSVSARKGDIVGATRLIFATNIHKAEVPIFIGLSKPCKTPKFHNDNMSHLVGTIKLHAPSA